MDTLLQTHYTFKRNGHDAHLSFAAYSALNLFMWVMSIAALLWLAHVYGFTVKSGALLRGSLLL